MLSIHNKVRHMFLQPNSVYTRLITRRVVLSVVFFALLIVLLSADFLPGKVFLQVGQVSDHDVVAPKTMSYKNVAKTEKLQAEVIAGIGNIYNTDVTVIKRVEEQLTAISHAAGNILANSRVLTLEQRAEKLQNNITVELPKSVWPSMAVLDEAGLKQGSGTNQTGINEVF